MVYCFAFIHRKDMEEGIMNQLIDEEALGVAFEMHRAIKLGYYELVYPDDRYTTVPWSFLHSYSNVALSRFPSHSSYEKHGENI